MRDTSLQPAMAFSKKLAILWAVESVCGTANFAAGALTTRLQVLLNIVFSEKCVAVFVFAGMLYSTRYF